MSFGSEVVGGFTRQPHFDGTEVGTTIWSLEVPAVLGDTYIRGTIKTLTGAFWRSGGVLGRSKKVWWSFGLVVNWCKIV